MMFFNVQERVGSSYFEVDIDIFGFKKTDFVL